MACDEEETKNQLNDYITGLTTYAEFICLVDIMKVKFDWLINDCHVRDSYTKFHEIGIKKFRIMILIDLGGSMFFRSCDKDLPDDFNFKMKRYKYFFRPGYKHLLLKIANNPRTVVAFYSSMIRKTITPVMLELLSDPELDEIKDKIGIFDRDYCSQMRDSKYYSDLKEEPYDTYRDLQLIFDDQFCQENGLNANNTLLIDSDSKKV